MQVVTQSTKASNIKRAWHHIDVKEKTLGRVATTIATLLMGKNKPYFVRNLDCGDYVVITSAKDIHVTGKKMDKKVYYRYSGYPGGLTKETLKEAMKKDPRFVIEHAVKGMLPQNRLRDQMLKRLFIFNENEHTYQDKFKPVKIEKSEKESK